MQQHRRRSVITIERSADVAEIENLMDLMSEMRGGGAGGRGRYLNLDEAASLVGALKAPSFSRGMNRLDVAGLQNISENAPLEGAVESGPPPVLRRASQARVRRVSTELFDTPASPRTHLPSPRSYGAAAPAAGGRGEASGRGGEGGGEAANGGSDGAQGDGQGKEGGEAPEELSRQPSGYLPSNLLSFSGRFMEPRMSRKRGKKSIFFNSGGSSRMTTFKRRPLMAKYILHADSQFLQIWQILVAIITLYTAILTPFHLGFQVYSTGGASSTASSTCASSWTSWCSCARAWSSRTGGTWPRPRPCSSTSAADLSST